MELTTKVGSIKGQKSSVGDSRQKVRDFLLVVCSDHVSTWAVFQLILV